MEENTNLLSINNIILKVLSATCTVISNYIKKLSTLAHSIKDFIN